MSSVPFAPPLVVNNLRLIVYGVASTKLEYAVHTHALDSLA